MRGVFVSLQEEDGISRVLSLSDFKILKEISKQKVT